ncbi:hypothetical protein CLOLEP_00242 [[Clostridium] leptum DSM 753]|uniref:Uncharacterized protein n=1 Tax=[Clostridium] leptum DSM 753 TaxID=428125 RepID=A7VNW6_9FIRM|nr:hypothetical protein CLOLEP_00863 [[Clostridium] leptum DSM 753]EDO62947.1 hypothetical protein CLOLEP_00242 [[Clostridium] leptum DSM 753]
MARSLEPPPGSGKAVGNVRKGGALISEHPQWEAFS